MDPARPGRAALAWTAVSLYLAAIFVQSALPPAVDAPSLPGSDKLLHLLAYGLLAALWSRALAAWPLAGRPAAVIAATAAVLSALYGIGDEIHQAFVPSRTADPWDWAADGTGAWLGAWLWAAARRRRFGPRV